MIKRPPRILITGFGRFPGAPVNPSSTLAQCLARSPVGRRHGLGDRTAQVLPTCWSTAAHFTEILDRTAPDIVLMIGLAARRRQVSIELHAVNRSRSFPDASRQRPAQRVLSPGKPDTLGCAAHPAPLLHALRQAGVPARLSRDAGRYICNALAYAAYDWAGQRPGRRAVFIHIPMPGTGLPRARMARGLEMLLNALTADFIASRRAFPTLTEVAAP